MDYRLIFLILFILIIFLIYLKFRHFSLREDTSNIIIENNTIYLNSLSLKQKISQMIIVRGDSFKLDFNKLNVGGIFLDKKKSPEEYKKIIEKYQKNSKIKLIVSTDMEGAWNPFPNIKMKKFSEIETKKDAYEIGKLHGELLKRAGFNLNFAPVAELEDNVYGGRAFRGTKKEIEDKLQNYIKGLQMYVKGTCKHYPGKGMKKNLHFFRDEEKITKDNLDLFKKCIKANISAIMIGHQIVQGVLNSKGYPSSVSPQVIKNLYDFKGLIISDEINMKGLKNFYSKKEDLYKDLINSGINVILDFYEEPKTLNVLFERVEEKVKKGEIKKDLIDKSVKKILRFKGYNVKDKV